MKLPNLKVCIGLLIALILTECVFVGFIGIWRETFWQAVSNRNYTKFVTYLVYFSIAALIACVVSGYSQYMGNYISLILRRNLTRKALKMKFEEHVENLPQRIQEDCMSYNKLKISLLCDGIRNFVVLLTYATILIYQLSMMYLIAPLAYAVIGTIIAARIAKPLVHLNYVNQNFEAKFRQALTKINFGLVYRNNYNLFKTTKYLAYFQSFYSQITVIVPYILLAPAYFGLKISFGVLMQTSAAINTIIDSLSYFIVSFNDFNKFLSCRKRLREINII